jgi:hypothetical protein
VITIKTISMIREGEIKEGCGEGEIKYDIFDTLQELL